MEVSEVVEAIATAIRPEQIILFGSRARGSARPDSDIDLLVVYGGPKSPRDVQLEIRRLFRFPSFSMDLFVMTPSQFAAGRHIANSLARQATERGVVCYG